MDYLLQSGFSKEQLQEFNALIPSVAPPKPLDKSTSVAHDASRLATNGHLVDQNGFKEPSRSHDDFQNITSHSEIAPPNGAAARNGAVRHDGVMPIAVIGMSCRLPGDASDTGKLWDFCSQGRSAWSEVPADKFNVDAFYHPDPERIDSV